MSRNEARLRFDIWYRGLGGLSSHAKMIYIVLLTEPSINHAGVGAIRIDLWASNAGLTVEETTKALVELGQEPQVAVDCTTQEVLIRTLIRNDGVADQPYVLKGALKDALRTRSPFLRHLLAAELRKLPPRRPDGVSKSGKPVIYPDPHAVADELDIPGPPASPQKGFESLSSVSPVALDIPSGSPDRKGFREPSETLRGGGRGSPSPTSKSKPKPNPDDDSLKGDLTGHDQISPSNLDLATQAVTTMIGTSRPRAIRDGLINRAVMLLNDGAQGVDLTEGLSAWRNTPNARVTWLDHKVSDAASRRESASQPKPPPKSTTDERVQACLDRGALYREAVANGYTTPAEQFAYAARKQGESSLADVIPLPGFAS